MNKIFSFENKDIEFIVDENNNVKVNATQMAKTFGKKIENFTRIENTKNFISACLKNANKRFLNIKKEEDLLISIQKSGTWMHEVLALKFAAWLNADFEVWGATATGTNCKINIGDAWKDVSEMKINVGDSWKAVTKVQQNIGDAWKTVFG